MVVLSRVTSYSPLPGEIITLRPIRGSTLSEAGVAVGVTHVVVGVHGANADMIAARHTAQKGLPSVLILQNSSERNRPKS